MSLWNLDFARKEAMAYEESIARAEGLGIVIDRAEAFRRYTESWDPLRSLADFVNDQIREALFRELADLTDGDRG